MIYISNKDGSINLPYDPDLLEWLLLQYPFSKYHVVVS